MDFLVTEFPRAEKYRIESQVEDILGSIPFDVTYLDELPAWKPERFMQAAVDASQLG